MSSEQARERVRQRLIASGLQHHADALLAGGRPSIRLRPHPAPLQFPRPAVVPGLEGDVVAIDSSGFHHLALLADGSVVAWGANWSGEVGDGSRNQRRGPHRVPGVGGAIAVSAGMSSSLALLADGSVLGWGSNTYGQLGGEPGPPWLVPAVVSGLERDVVQVWAGPPTLAISRDGRAWKLGPTVSEAGRGVAVPASRALVEAPAPIVRFEAGGRLAVLADGSLARWPDDGIGAGPPEIVGELQRVVRAIGLATNGFALQTDGSVVAWGGLLGNGTTSYSPRPTAVSGLDRDVVDIAQIGGSRFALKRDGSVWAWGSGDKGRLGQGTSDDALVPALVPGLASGVTAIAPTVALRDDGSLWAWGGDRLPDPPEVDQSIPVGASKLGGRPDLPPGFRWPMEHSRTLAFLAQVRLEGLRHLDEAHLLPAGGLLSFFHDMDEHPPYATVGVVSWFEPGLDLARTDFPEALPPERRERAVPVVPEADFTLFPWPPGSLSSDESSAYHYDVLPDDRDLHRMLGYPDLIQDTPAPDDGVLLLQLDFYDNESFPDHAGRLYFLIADEDLAAGRFDLAWVDYECD